MNRLFRNGAPSLSDYILFTVFVLFYGLAITLILSPGMLLPGKTNATPASVSAPALWTQ